MLNLISFFIFTISPLKGALLSLIVPGLGEKLAGNEKEFYLMISGEALLLGSYFTGSIIKKEIRNDYKIFAKKFANAFAGTDDEKYWNAVENYYNYDIYYEFLLREARQSHPDDPLSWEKYANENSVKYRWSWVDTTSWDNFLLKRERERLIESRLKLVQGFLISYHIFSAIYTFIHLKLQQKDKLGMSGGINIFESRANLKIVYRF